MLTRQMPRGLCHRLYDVDHELLFSDYNKKYTKIRGFALFIYSINNNVYGYGLME